MIDLCQNETLMDKYLYIFIKSIILFFFLSSISLLNSGYIYAGSLSEEAVSYRVEGFKAQDSGDIDTAISYYQKSAALDPNYATPHNDLGILYEAKGLLDRAESEYQKALAIDKNYAKAHTNLALLYERKGELEKAAFHWMKRYRLGEPGDMWKEEARQRLEKLGLIGSGSKDARIQPAKERKRKSDKELIVKKSEPKSWTRLGSKGKKETTTKKKAPEKQQVEEKFQKIEDARKFALQEEIQESLRLAEERLRKERTQEESGGNLETIKKDVSEKVSKAKTSRSEKNILISKPNPKTKVYYSKAYSYYKKGEYSHALDTIRIAKREYPDDLSLLELEETVKDKMKEERIEDHYNKGILLYQQNDRAGAKEEFETILDMLPE